MRFTLIDQVLERGPDRLVAVKNLTSAEEYLADHFPGFAVMPGVMMLETLVQAARLLVSGPDSDDAPNGSDALRQPGNQRGPLVLTAVRSVRYGQMVRPGQTLRVEVSIRSQDEHGWELTGVGQVKDQVAVQGRFRVAPLGI